MKLHLPKLLLTAVLAVCVAPAAWGEVTTGQAIKIGEAEYTGTVKVMTATGDITAGNLTGADYVVLQQARTQVNNSTLSDGVNPTIVISTYQVKPTGDGAEYGASATPGQLFVDAWGTSGVTLNNNIILGEYSTTESGGAMRLHESKQDAKIILNGAFTLVADSDISVGGGGNDGRYNYLQGVIEGEGKRLTINHLNGSTSRVIMSGGATLGTLAGSVKEILLSSTKADGTTAAAGTTYTIGTLSHTGTMTVDSGVTLTIGSSLKSGTLVNNGTLRIEDWSGFDYTFAGAESVTENGLYDVIKEYQVINGATLGDGSSTKYWYNDTEYDFSAGYTEAVAGEKYYAVINGVVTVGGSAPTDGTTEAARFFVRGGTLALADENIAAFTRDIIVDAGDGGKATVAIANGQTQTYESLGITNLVQVQSGSYVLGITGEGTVVTTNYQSSNGASFYSGEISITNKGKLQMTALDSLGWGNGNAVSKITIDDATLALGARQTWGTDFELRNGATITATAEPASSGTNGPGIDIYGKSVTCTVSGTGNIFEDTVGLRLRDSLSIDIAQGGELSLQGIMVNDGHVGSATLTKTGEGTLILDGVAKTLDNKFIVSAGTLQLGTKITLKKALEVNGTGVLKVTDGGKVYLGSGLTQVGEAEKPADGENGWSLANVCVATASDSDSLGNLTTVYWGDGQESALTPVDSDTGVTSYLACMGIDYYVREIGKGAEYSAATGLTNAGTIYMSDETTLVVKDNLNTNKVSVSDGDKVNYVVNDTTLTVDKGETETGIAKVTLSDGATLKLANPHGSMGTSENKVAITMKDNATISLYNGNTQGVDSRHLWADILVNNSDDQTARIEGSIYGNGATVSGTIKGNGKVTLSKLADGGNAYTIASTISDGDAEGNQLALVVDTDTATVTVSGDNSFTGGTTVNSGTLKLGHVNALGNGNYAITVNGGTLDINGNALTYDNSGNGGNAYQGRTVTLGEGTTLTNTGGAVGGGKGQISHLILTGDATISGSENATHGLVNGGYGQTTIAMDGRTLTKTGGNTFLLYNTTITGGGTVQVNEGTLQIAGHGSAGTTATDTVFATNGGTINIINKTLAVKGISGSTGVIQGSETGAKLTLTSDEDHGYGGTISGALALEKNGTGTQTLSGTNTYTGGTTINAGTLKLGHKSALGEGSVTVNNGATLDANGTGDVINAVTLKDGATLQNTAGNGISCGTLQFPNITLESAEGTVGNVTVNAEKAFGMLGSGHGQTNLNLNGNTLTKRGGALFFLSNTVASAGTLKVLEGTLAAGISGPSTSTDTLNISAVSVEVGQVDADNKGTFKLGQLPNSGKYNLEKSIKSLKFDGGKVEVTSSSVLTVTNGTTVTAKGGEITGGGSANLGTLTLEAGATLTASGSLTIGALNLDLSSYTTDYSQVHTLVSAADGLTFTGDLTSYTDVVVGNYTATVSKTDNALTLSYTANQVDVLDSLTVTDASLSGTMLTLNVDAALTEYDFTNGGKIIIPGISDSIMDKILGFDNLPTDGMVGITLVHGEKTYVADGTNYQLGFQGNDGVYWGENVGGNWQYQAQYIPEPATATLSLLALAGLAARRRRK